MSLISLNLPSPPQFTNSGCTPAAPSADFVQALMGFPAAAGKVVTRATAVRVASFLSAVKTLTFDIAKMPLILRESTIANGRQRIAHAISNPLYSLLKDCPNSWQTSYQLRCFLVSQLIMNGNCYCQIIRDGKGDILALIPLNAWHMQQKWDRSNPNKPTPYWVYVDGHNTRRFEQADIWHTTNMNIEGNGIEGTAIIVLAKESLSVLMAAEEVAGRNFANGLGMGGFITQPQDVDVDETQGQNIIDRLKRDFAGSQNAGKFTMLPFGTKWEKMTFNAQESQLLESRKWNAEEVVRLLGGAPLLVKLGLGAQNSTYASSSAFLDEYYNTCLSPFCISIEQTITRDLIAPKDRSRLSAKHDTWVILRGSPKERAEYYQARITNGQLSPNQVAVLEDEDTIDAFGDYRFFPANSGAFDPASGQVFIPGQKPPTPQPEEASKPDSTDEANGDSEPAGTSDKVKNRLTTLANTLADRILRKEQKSGTVEAKFVAEVLDISLALAEQYINARGQMNDTQAREMLCSLIINGDENRDSKGRFAPGSTSDAHAILHTPAVHDQLTKLYKDAQHTYYPQLSGVQVKGQEYSFTINKDGSVSPITSSGLDKKNEVEITPGQTTDIAHTHPLHADPKPSPGDVATAEKNGVDNYSLSIDQLRVAQPDGSTHQVGTVSWKHGNLEIKDK